MTEYECDKCNKKFNSEDGFNMHNKAKHPVTNESKSMTPQQKRSIKRWSISIIILLLFVGGIWFFAANAKLLPPTIMEGHIEVSPPSHILKEPMGIAVQKHMLEHADGKTRPGVILNYNCKDFNCEPDMIQKLEAFAEIYPENVYIAPFPKMSAKIALTKLGRIKTFDEFNEEEIDGFIRFG